MFYSVQLAKLPNESIWYESKRKRKRKQGNNAKTKKKRQCRIWEKKTLNTERKTSEERPVKKEQGRKNREEEEDMLFRGNLSEYWLI